MAQSGVLIHEKPDLKTSQQTEQKTKKDKTVHCASCQAQLGFWSQRLSIDGKQEHVFPNPLGQMCSLYTFASIFGAQLLGESTLEFTWFKNYHWTIALCENCQEHLGWYYETESPHSPLVFWGLLKSKIVIQTQDSGSLPT